MLRERSDLRMDDSVITFVDSILYFDYLLYCDEIEFEDRMKKIIQQDDIILFMQSFHSYIQEDCIYQSEKKRLLRMVDCMNAKPNIYFEDIGALKQNILSKETLEDHPMVKACAMGQYPLFLTMCSHQVGDLDENLDSVYTPYMIVSYLGITISNLIERFPFFASSSQFLPQIIFILKGRIALLQSTYEQEYQTVLLKYDGNGYAFEQSYDVADIIRIKEQEQDIVEILCFILSLLEKIDLQRSEKKFVYNRHLN